MTADLRTGLERAGRMAPPEEPDPFERLRRRRERKARRGRAAAATLSLLLVAGAVGGAMLAFRSPGAPTAHTAAGGPSVDLSIPPHAYYYLDQIGYSAPSDEPGVIMSVVDGTRSWYRADDSGRIVTRSDADVTDRSYDPGAFLQDTGDLTYLSTDPDQLLTQMTERMQPTGRSPEPFDQFTPGPGQDGHVTAGLVRSIGELLNDPNSTPALKAALFRVASSLQGISVTRDATDPTGRPAILLSIQTEETNHDWWFDPDSEQLLAMRTSDPATGDVRGLEIVRASGVANSTDDGGDLTPSFIPPPVHEPQKP